MVAVTGNGTAIRGLGGAAGFGETMIARGDDTAVAIDLGAVFASGIPFAPGVAANQVYLHTDGYLTFGARGPLTPADPSSLTTAFIAPFMADIDTRLDGEGTESGPVWLDIDNVNDVVTVTWESVGFYRRNANLTNTFQLQLYQQNDGTVDIVFRYQRIDWSSGDLQGGWEGVGGTPAFLGYRFATQGAATTLPASGNEAGVLALETTTGNTGQNGLWHFRYVGDINQGGGSGNEVLTGSSGADTLNGGAGNDTVAGLGGADVLTGGVGIDWLDYIASLQAVTINLGTNLASGGDASGDQISGFEAVRGSAYADDLTGTVNSDNLEGIAGNDLLSGLAGNDYLSGGDGNDTLMGGAGADQLQGGAGRDRVSYANATSGVRIDLRQPGQSTGDAAGDSFTDIEEVAGSDHADALSGTLGSDLLLGEAGDDTLSGSGGDDSLYGGAGEDRLMGGSGADLLDGGMGHDLLSYLDATGGLIIDLAMPSNNTGFAAGDYWSEIEAFEGSNHDDTIRGDGNANWLDGAQGDDRLDGGAGDDSLLGGDGNDTLLGAAGADRLEGGAGLDQVSYQTSGAGVTVNLEGRPNSGGDAAGDLLIGIEMIEGSNHADSLLGGTGDDTLLGGDGADRLDGGQGRDQLFGGAGDDTLFGNPANEVLDGGAGVDIVSYIGANAGVRVNLSQPSQNQGDAQGDTLTSIEGVAGSNSRDVITGNSGNNLIWGMGGTDLLYGAAGADTIDGGLGADSIAGGAGNDSLAGGDSDDLIAGDDSSDLPFDGSLFNFFQGLRPSPPTDGGSAPVLGHDDILFGGAGSDRLFGGQGNDTLDGGAGHDRLHGGAGADQFIHGGGNGNGMDMILDYDAGEGDVLVFTGGAAAAGDFSVTRVNAPGTGAPQIAELQITYRPTGQQLWTLQDAADISSLMLTIGNQTFDLLG